MCSLPSDNIRSRVRGAVRWQLQECAKQPAEGGEQDVTLTPVQPHFSLPTGAWRSSWPPRHDHFTLRQAHSSLCYGVEHIYVSYNVQIRYVHHNYHVEICFHRKRSLRTVYQTFIARPSARSAHEGSGPCMSLLEGLAPSQPARPPSPKIRRPLSFSHSSLHTNSPYKS